MKLRERTFHLPFGLLRFLYVRTTKSLLLWLDEQGPTSRREIEKAWMGTIGNEKELAVMLTLLIRYGTVTEKDTTLQVTARGKDFLDYLDLRKHI
jgi:hypothetical protein